jgi:Tol biopolymer transport system component/DNA-binding winged helix-turn-helix (wHTH) protein
MVMTIQGPCFEFDDVRVDVANARAWKAEKPLAIEPKALRVLVYLLEHRGRLVEKDELLSAVWPDTFVTENALTRAIAHLRKALGDSKTGAKYIETAPTRGYRFIATATVRESPTTATGGSAPVSPPAATGFTPGATRPPLRMARFAMVVVAFAAIIGVIWWVAARKTEPTHILGLKRLQATSSPGMDIFPSFSPDGSTIAYSSDANGKFEIYLKQLTRGGQVVQLTNDGQINLQPSWSPDGKTLAYYCVGRAGIWVVPALGGVPRQLTTFGSSPAWSPDSSQIVFQSGGIRDLSATADVSIAASTLWAVSLHDGATRQITQPMHPAGAHNSPAWSPDGKSIAFTVSDFGDASGLWSIRADGTGLRRLIPGGAVFNPVYARDGNSLYLGFLGFGDFAIWKVPVSATLAEIKSRGEKIVSTFPAVPRYLAISPDGHSLAYSDVSTISELNALPLSSETGEAIGPPVALTQDTRFRKIVPRFSPDGKRIVFLVGSASFESGLWVMDSDGKNAIQISGRCFTPAWLPNSEEILCTDESGDPPRNVLVRYRLDTKREEILRSMPPGSYSISISPDGKSVVFMSASSGAPNLWLTPLNGGDAKQLTFDSELAGFPSFSPDGKTIGYERKRGDTTSVMAVPSAGGTPRQLTDDEGQSWPHSWSPDGKRVAFAGLRDGVWNVWSVTTDTKQEKKLTRYTQMNQYVRYPSWSPDGRHIVYEFGQTHANVWIVALN